MISAYFQEQKRYSLTDISSNLQLLDQDLIPIVRKLKEYGIIKTVNYSAKERDLSDLDDSSLLITDVSVDDSICYYVFTFVGVVVISGVVLKCYPKYIQQDILESNEEKQGQKKVKKEPKEELGQILKVIEKYNSKDQIVHIFSDKSEEGSFSSLSVFLFLIQDYFENGSYINTEDIVEINGSGEILWDKTINQSLALISKNKPYYVELFTKRRVDNDADYFKRLHECILTRISKEMKEADLLDLFEITELDLSDEELDSFGDADEILQRIENELNTQFNTRKQLVLNAIYSYIKNTSHHSDMDYISLYGTNSFNLVWENVCAEILDNLLQTQLESLRLPTSSGLLHQDYKDRHNLKLIEIIEKPHWSIVDKNATETLIPDLITIRGDRFIIFDAKYYTPTFKKGQTPKGQPGIESVTKQYLYQLAYQDFIAKNGFKKIVNCFLMPTDATSVQDWGIVSMKMFQSFNLQDIHVRAIPAIKAYECYLSGKKMNLNELQLKLM